MNRTFEKKVKAGFRAAMLISLGVGGIAFFSVGRMADSAAWVSHTQDVLLATESILRLAQEAESGQQGYLLGRNPGMLSEYTEASGALKTAISGLRALVSDNPLQSVRAVRLQGLMEEWMERLNEGLAAPRSLAGADGRSAGISGIRSREKAAIAVARELESEERRLLMERTAKEIRMAWITRAAIFMGMAISTLLLQLAMRLNFRGIAERQSAADALRRAKEEAEAGSRSKSEFLANMSHELRTPLNSIIGFTHVVMKNKGGRLSDQDIAYLDKVQSNGRNLLGLINSILDVSKIEAGKMTVEWSDVDVAALAADVGAQFETQALEKDLRLRTEIPADLAAIRADATKLRQVLNNLVGNALKFTEAGSVTLRVIAFPPAGPSAGRAPARIEVEDTGPGVPLERQASIFEAFHQADNSISRKFGGTGLGLTISRSLAGMMGFRLEISSQAGKGSVFAIHLDPPAPGAVPANANGILRFPNPPEPSFSGTRAGTARGHADGPILVIDDDPDSRILITQMLDEAGYRAVTAAGGEEGVRMAKASLPSAIILDLLMPDMDGKATLQALRSERVLAEIPIIIASIIAKDNGMELRGPGHFLEKPLDRFRLAEALEKSLQGRPPERSKP